MKANAISEKSPQLTSLIEALREFEQAHKRWMSLSVFTQEGEAAKQWKNSCGARYAAARSAWEKSVADKIAVAA